MIRLSPAKRARLARALRAAVASLSEQSTYSGLQVAAIGWGVADSKAAGAAALAATVFGLVKWVLPDAAGARDKDGNGA